MTMSVVSPLDHVNPCSMSINLYLSDSNALLRGSLCIALEKSGMTVVGQSENGGSMLQQSELLDTADVLLIRDDLPDMCCADAVEKIRLQHAELKVVGIVSLNNRDSVVSAYRAGVEGFVTTNVSPEALIDVLRTVQGGNKSICHEVSELLLQTLLGDDSNGALSRRLTPREREVLEMIADGKSTKQIAGTLEISGSTVSVHRREISRKLDIHSIAELTKFAIREGLSQL